MRLQARQASALSIGLGSPVGSWRVVVAMVTTDLALCSLIRMDLPYRYDDSLLLDPCGVTPQPVGHRAAVTKA